MKRTQIAKTLSTKEICRRKLPVFYGSRDNFYHGFKECMNNAIDEINENYEEGIVNIILDKDCQTITVTDTGRGIPLFIEDNYVKIFEKIFAGTKDEVEGFNTGTNGTGLAVLNYTSEYFYVKSVHDGVEEVVEYRKGGELVDKYTNKINDANVHGTTFTFKLDIGVYTNITYNILCIKEIIKMLSIVSPKIKFNFYHNDEVVEFHFNSIEEFFTEEKHTSSIIIGGEDTVISTVKEIEETNIIRGVISTQVSPIQHTFLNGNHLKEHGAIYDGVIAGAKKFFNSNFNKKYTDKDIKDSLGFIIDYKSSNVEYANQTKLSTNKSIYKKITSDYVSTILEVEKVKNIDNINKLISHIDQVNKANTNNDKARERLQKELTKKIEGVGNKPKKLINCRAKGMDAELFICEGDSALSGFVDARDGKFQAGFAIRGKFINVLKTEEKKIQKNQEFKDLIQIIGVGMGKDLDLSNLNFGKIVMLVDSDPDGYAIACLLLNFIWKYIPQLLTEGLVYKAETPLFEIRDNNDKMYYAYDEDERDDIVSKIKGARVSRIKGVGEADSGALWDTALNPETRKLTQFKIEDEVSFNKKMEEWFAKDVTPRKKMLLDNEIDLGEMN